LPLLPAKSAWQNKDVVITDTATGTDLITRNKQILITDTSSGSEVITRNKIIQILDAASGVDQVIRKNIITILDTALGSDTPFLSKLFKILDVAAGSDIVTINKILTILESAFATDTVRRDKILVILETALATDSINIITILSILDRLLGIDTVNIVKPSVTGEGGVPEQRRPAYPVRPLVFEHERPIPQAKTFYMALRITETKTTNIKLRIKFISWTKKTFKMQIRIINDILYKMQRSFKTIFSSKQSVRFQVLERVYSHQEKKLLLKYKIGETKEKKIILQIPIKDLKKISELFSLIDKNWIDIGDTDPESIILNLTMEEDNDDELL